MADQGMYVGLYPPPPGVTPNVVNPPSLRNYDYAGRVICIFLTTSVVAMRMYTKLALVKKTMVEDYLCCLAWIGYLGQSALSILADHHGSGVHIWNVTLEDYVMYCKISWVGLITFGPTILLAKLSILLMILRIFRPDRTSKTFFFTYFFIFANSIFYLLAMFLMTFMCTPIKKIWLQWIPGKCINVKHLNLASTVINVASDFSLLLLPMPSVWRLQMELRRKLALCAVFGAGLICIASVIRLAISVHGLWSEDVTYNWFWEFVTSSIEIALGIVCGCLPCLPAFFRHIGTKISTSNSSSGAPYGANRERNPPPKYASGSINVRSRSKRHGTTNPWDDLDDSKLLSKSSYLELDENKHSGKRNNPEVTVTARGGPATISEETMAASQQQQPVDLEQGGGGGGGAKGGEGRTQGF